MWFGLTIARSSPASTQWCRKTELRTARGRGETPKETLETPSEVLTPGDLGLDPADPLDRLDRRGLPLLVAGGQGEGERVEDQRLGLEAVLVAGDVAQPFGDLDLALGRLRHPDLVDRQRDQRRPVGLGQRDDHVGLVAAGLEVDRVDDRPPGDLLERRLHHLRLGRVDLDRRRLGQRDPLDDGAHLLVLVLALGQRHADVEHVGAAFDLVFGDLDEAVVVVGEQQFLGLFRALRVDPLADQGRARLLHERGGGHHRGDLDRPGAGRSPGTWPPTRSRIAPMCSGVVPQQPPTMPTP